MATGMATAEVAVLCACARRRAQTEGIGSLGAEVDLDWDTLLQTARTHGVAELLLAPLSTGALKVPPQIMADLERRVIEATGQNLNRTTELTGLLQLLSSHDIQALAFKGPALAAGVYGHLGRRLSSDIDLFVHRRDVPRVRSLLLGQGYLVPPRASRRGGSLLHGLFPAAGRDDMLLPGHQWQTMVDVHVGFASWRFGIELEPAALFDRATIVDVAGHQVPTLHPNDLLLVLAIHGMMHCWSPLRLVSDIDAVVDLVDDWDAVIDRAEAAGMRRILWVALLLAQRMLGTALPPGVAARATTDAGAIEIVGVAAARLFDADAVPNWNRRSWLRSFLDTPQRRWRFVARDTIHEWFLIFPWNRRWMS